MRGAIKKPRKLRSLKVLDLNEELAFLAYFGIRFGCGINKLHRISGPLGNKSTPPQPAIFKLLVSV
jgi:hypothetical protein